jgi:mannose-6-phosphate isomerase
MTVQYTKGESDNRPWGTWEVLDTGTHHAVKKISIDPGEKISLQVHEHRDEHWIVVAGQGTATLSHDTLDVTINDHIQIFAGQNHRIANTGKDPLVMIEVQFGEQLEEADITRLEDNYGR